MFKFLKRFQEIKEEQLKLEIEQTKVLEEIYLLLQMRSPFFPLIDILFKNKKNKKRK
jgi:hypothetical protein